MKQHFITICFESLKEVFRLLHASDTRWRQSLRLADSVLGTKVETRGFRNIYSTVSLHFLIILCLTILKLESSTVCKFNFVLLGHFGWRTGPSSSWRQCSKPGALVGNHLRADQGPLRQGLGTRCTRWGTPKAQVSGTDLHNRGMQER